MAEPPIDPPADPPFDVRPVTLEGTFVRLEPLTVRHVFDLLEAAADDDVWRYMTIARPRELADVERYVAAALSQEHGRQVAFATIDLATGRAVGSTRYFDVRPNDRGLEVGHTWIGRASWGSVINPEAKRLMLAHAFEERGAVRVQLKTDARNLRSQGAMAKLGFTREGTLRRHLLLPDGTFRDSVYFSVLADEWPTVRAHLDAIVARARGC